MLKRSNMEYRRESDVCSSSARLDEARRAQAPTLPRLMLRETRARHTSPYDSSLRVTYTYNKQRYPAVYRELECIMRD
jgi:hypothetical protein